MPKRLLSSRLLIVISCWSLLFLRTADKRPEASEARHQPKLVVIIVIDQFRNDYLVRFQPFFVERGFNLLLSGANFVNCRYDYAVTVTAAGHATLFTGSYPNVHGIIDNEWYDRSLGRFVNCVEDPSTKLVETNEGSEEQPGASPQYLLGSTIGDELRVATGFQSKVVAISLKDRGAILPGGHTANAAYWYKASTGQFVSSTYYMTKAPSWVVKFNRQSPTKEYCGKDWQALSETPGAGRKVFGGINTQSSETCPNKEFLEWFQATPFVTDLELKFAREVVHKERLGQDSTTDLLAISLSVNDYVGHQFGPYSPELADLTLRTDRYLAEFFDDLDRIVGLKNVWIILSADHGVAPTPQFVKEHRLGMGRFCERTLRVAVEEGLSQAFGRERWIQAVALPYLYLDQAALKKRQVPPEKAEAEAAKVASSVPGVRMAYTRSQLLSAETKTSRLARKAANSFDGRRSGDLFLILDPFAVPSGNDTETTHGSPWNYDAQVPLLLWGSAFEPGVYTAACEPVDLAPTLAVALGLNQPAGAQGHALSSALRQK